MLGRCLGSAVPAAAPFCPAANPFDSTATVREFGECQHACRAPDAWQLSLCEGFDYGNTTCGIGSCDRHTTASACAAGDGHWELDDFSGASCSDVQSVTNYVVYSASRTGEGMSSGMVAARTADIIAAGGEDCCAGFTMAGYAFCENADLANLGNYDLISTSCLVCLADTDGDIPGCIAANPIPQPAPTCEAADNDAVVRSPLLLLAVALPWPHIRHAWTQNAYFVTCITTGDCSGDALFGSLSP